jgi:phosphoadenosine phosphosulfate reductase
MLRAIGRYHAWVSDARAGARVVQWDTQFDLMKIQPMLNWTRRDVWEFIRARDVPYNALHDQGYPSVGCRPCTLRAVGSRDDHFGCQAGLEIVSRPGTPAPLR